MTEDEIIERAIELLPEIGRRMHGPPAGGAHPLAQELHPGQKKALVYLYHHGGASVGQLASGLGVSMPAASELIDRLVDADCIERRANPADRRQVLVDLTPRARAFGDMMHALRRRQLRAALDCLEPHERPVFLRSLQALVEALRIETADLPSLSPGCAQPARSD